jgi:hypothetical protein
MTKTTQIFIDLPDLKGLRLNCAMCSAVLILSFSDQRAVPSACPNCKAHWGSLNRDTRPTADYLTGLRDALKAASDAVRDAQTVNFSVSLEVSEEA